MAGSLRPRPNARRSTEESMTAPLPAIDGVDWTRLSAWMDERGLPGGEIHDAELLTGGTQNVLIRFCRGGREMVLRRPPVHKRKNSDETMRREARVLGALAGSDVPHPGLIADCHDENVLGAAFYLMEPIRGFNPATGLPEPHRSSAALRHRMGLSMVESIAALGAVDYLAVGLEDFGRPEGYLERQVPRWRAQLDGYSAFEGYAGPDIPHVEETASWLETHRPSAFAPGIIHGDFHLANVMIAPDSAEVAALVDWELSTIGDPLLDLGWLLATWPDPDGHGGGVSTISPWDGFPDAAELVDHYAKRTKRDMAHIAWYEVLACYKLGIILEGSHARACAGKAPKGIGDALHDITVGLFERAARRSTAAA